ncbi:hypothetical protein ACFQ36_12290 [Arthrobacter sp. GCM10027362]|uniref:hypothetical protein n=1 Tax=Arthrobacter sp. GCM10027362 TaxID=3273379 RepID=UPI0036386CC2
MTIDRYLRINAHLRLFLETSGQDHVGAEDARWLAFERQFRPAGASCRLMHAGALLAALPEFLGGSWFMPHGVDCRVQVSQSSRLVYWLICRGLVDFRRQRQDLVRFRAALDARQQQRNAVEDTGLSVSSMWASGVKSRPVLAMNPLRRALPRRHKGSANRVKSQASRRKAPPQGPGRPARRPPQICPPAHS